MASFDSDLEDPLPSNIVDKFVIRFLATGNFIQCLESKIIQLSEVTKL